MLGHSVPTPATALARPSQAAASAVRPGIARPASPVVAVISPHTFRSQAFQSQTICPLYDWSTNF
jgi:hypothetical protein